ncbi:hypothetical protein DH2020_046159 [Rehmannia glutinosa]|uniref:Uncharacterized protein n=1 Tax=Rehmannia glutinosa TaxID=99300 RepID=A0ABR0UCW3_REHGL
MASLQDIAASAFINLVSVLAFLLGFAFLRLQPICDRVYFAKWYKEGIRASPKKGALLKKFVNLDLKTYLMFWTWMTEALRMPELELIDHAGLDSVVYIRIYLIGLKIFVPIAILAFAVLVPVNWTGETLDNIADLTYSDIDKFSISNVPSGSLSFSKAPPDQFTVLVRNIPPDPDESVSEHVEHFFCVNHPDHYLTHQVVYNANRLARLVEKMNRLRNWLTYYETQLEKNPIKRPRTKVFPLHVNVFYDVGFWGLFGNSVDAIDYYKAEIQRIIHEEDAEREKVMRDPKAIVPAAFVSFKSRWGAAVCAQTQQSLNPTIWLTEWAPEPRDVYWDNLSIPYVQLAVKRLIIVVAMFFLTFFFMIPIAFVQSLASIDGMAKVLVFLRPLFRKKRIKSVVQGYLPGIALKIFTTCLPTILMTMSKIEGHTSRSALDRRTAGKIPKTVGVAIPMKATFFITYIMVDGWSGVAAEVIRLVPLIKFHLKNTLFVKTEWDREKAMDPGFLDFATTEPQIQLYFLLGLVYSVVTPLILPFIIVFFAFSYVIYRHQIINVYDQKYESGASFWPDVHRRVIIGLIISQVLLMGLLSTKNAAKSTPLLLLLTVLTIWFHRFCKGCFESAFVKFPLVEAMRKDTIERALEPKLNLRAYLQDAYVHPALKGMEIERPKAVDDEENNPLVSTKRDSHRSSSSSSGSFTYEAMEELLSYLTPDHAS